MNDNLTTIDWTYKYQPKEIDDLIIDDENYKTFKSYLDKETFVNCCLYGTQGIGKTSMAHIVINSIPNCTNLFINASAENGVDVIRHKVKEFTKFVGYSKTKIVVLDEVNRMSAAAQDSLRTLIDECLEDTRFILTTNYINKLIPPLRSRCIPINVKPPETKIMKRLLTILKNENIKAPKDELIKTLKLIIKEHYPDIRSMIKHLEICCSNNILNYRKFNSNEKLKEVIEFIKKNINNQNKCRKFWLERENDFEKDYQILSGELYNSFSDNPDVMHLIADYLRTMPNVLDQEIQFNDLVYSINLLLQ